MEPSVSEELKQEIKEDEQVVELKENGRRIHEDEIVKILSNMSLATRSILWELDPDDIKYLNNVLKREVDGKKIITKKELRRELIRELYKENKKGGK